MLLLLLWSLFFFFFSFFFFVEESENILTTREREMFYLTTHATHFIYGYMASDIWLSTILIVRKETRCRHIGYCYRLTARVLLYAPSHRQGSTYHGLCYTSRGALAGTRNSSMGPPHEGFLTTKSYKIIIYVQETRGLCTKFVFVLMFKVKHTGTASWLVSYIRNDKRAKVKRCSSHHQHYDNQKTRYTDTDFLNKKYIFIYYN